MKRLLFFLLFPFLVFGQSGMSVAPQYVGVDPSGPCVNQNLPHLWSLSTFSEWYCNGTPGTWTAFNAALATTATTATNLAAGTAGQYPYQTGAGATGFRTPNAASGPVVLDSSGNATLTGSLTMSAAPLILSGNISAAAWTTSGVRIKGVPGTMTDTTSTGTVATAYTDVLGGNTINSSHTNTFTNYYTMWAKNPVAGTATITNSWAVGGDSLYIGTSNPFKVTAAGVVTTGGSLSVTGVISSGTYQFGGSTASYPELKRSGTTIQARLADDSAYASFVLRSTNYTAQTRGGCGTQTDFVVDATDNTKVTSASYNFVAADVGGTLQVTAGTSWTTGDYTISSVAANAAFLDRSPAAVGTTGGTANYNRGRVMMVQGATDDTLAICAKVASTYGWQVLY